MPRMPWSNRNVDLREACLNCLIIIKNHYRVYDKLIKKILFPIIFNLFSFLIYFFHFFFISSFKIVSYGLWPLFSFVSDIPGVFVIFDNFIIIRFNYLNFRLMTQFGESSLIFLNHFWGWCPAMWFLLLYWSRSIDQRGFLNRDFLRFLTLAILQAKRFLDRGPLSALCDPGTRPNLRYQLTFENR